LALEREDGPVALLLSRQGITTLDRNEVSPAEESSRGGYVLWESVGEGVAELILISTGAEVGITLEAGRQLAREGRAVRVVAMPCIELFEAQPEDYRKAVLPPAVTARLAVEPGATMGWWKWVGTDGDVLGLDHYGASAPGAIVLREFGFTAENVAARALALLERLA
jgi:transketolase